MASRFGCDSDYWSNACKLDKLARRFIDAELAKGEPSLALLAEDLWFVLCQRMVYFDLFFWSKPEPTSAVDIALID